MQFSIHLYNSNMILIIFGIITFYFFVKWFSKPKDYPDGPFRLPVIGNLHQLGEFPQIELLKMKKKYGPILSVKFGSMETIIINEIKLMKEAMSHPAFSGRPSWVNFLARSRGERRGFIMNEGKEFNEQRRVILKSLKDFGLGKSSMESLINEEIEELVRTIKATNGKPQELQYLFSSAALNALMVILFGTRLNQKDPSFMKNIEYIDGIFPNKRSMKAVSIIMPWLIKISKSLTGFNEVMDGFKSIDNLIVSFISSHEESRVDGSPRDFIDAYLDEMEKQKFNENSSFYGQRGKENLIYTIFDFFAGGGETTRVGINWACVTLVNYPELQVKLREEIKRVAGNGCPSLIDRSKMPYTEAFINEVLRFNTIGPLGFPRRSTEDSVFHGFKIPAGTNVVVNIYAAHLDKAAWGDPEVFRPERFIKDDGTVSRPEAFFAFGAGRRTCPGELLARDTMFIFITRLIHNFQILPDLENPEKPHFKFANTLFTSVPTYKRVAFASI